jgi:5-methylcytosine-specific restriction enzyme A
MAWSKESSTARGYGFAWQKLRLVILERDCYLCQCAECAKRQVPLPANEVDHILPKAQGGTDDESNLRAVNTECHKRLTIAQKGHKPAESLKFSASGRVVW